MAAAGLLARTGLLARRTGEPVLGEAHDGDPGRGECTLGTELLLLGNTPGGASGTACAKGPRPRERAGPSDRIRDETDRKAWRVDNVVIYALSVLPTPRGHSTPLSCNGCGGGNVL